MVKIETMEKVGSKEERRLKGRREQENMMEKKYMAPRNVKYLVAGLGSHHLEKKWSFTINLLHNFPT